MMQNSSTMVTLLLLVEDDPGDVELMRESLCTTTLTVEMHVVDDGVKALQYLRKIGPFCDAPRPDMVLLDLNMPKMGGRDVLREIRKDDALKDMPVIILTTSDADADIAACYLLGANCYLTKPVGLDAFNTFMRTLEDFWFTLAKLPKHDKG